MVACAACGSAAADGHRFCGFCGAPLAGPGAAPPGDSANAATAREERKVVSVVFVDLVDFTARSERLDVEDVRRLLAGYHAAVRPVLERFGGTVEKFIGDAVVAVFGAPVTHEDDAERAVRAALAAIDAVRDLDAGLHVRVAVNTGEALVDLAAASSTTDGMAAGDVVNTAARLQAAAPVDGVIVGAATYETTRREIVYRAAESIVAKGKAQRVPCWVALRPRSLLPEQTRERTPLVGRDAERRALAGVFHACCDERRARLVTITGEAGIGKSRLVADLGAAIDTTSELVTWRDGRVLPYGDGGGLWALEQMVKQECGVFDSDSRATMVDKVTAAVAALGIANPDDTFVARQVARLLGADVGGGATGSQRDAFAGWRMFVEAIARQTPTVLVFDDVHWAEAVLLDCIEHLATYIVGVPLLIVAIARPELRAHRPDWPGAARDAVTIALDQLDARDVAEIVRGALDGPALPDDIERVLLERAQGNPLFALEYARSIGERGVVDDAIPESVHGLIAARIDGLDGGAKSFLQRAAILGDTGWFEAVAALGGTPDGASLAKAFDELERQQFLRRRRGSSIEGAGEFEFAHALVRDVAYRQLPRRLRCRVHEAAATWLREVAGDRTQLSELVAHHCTVALTLAEELGEPAGPLRAATITALVDATRQAATRHDHEAAARHAERALALIPGPDDEATLLVARELARCGLDQPDHRSLYRALEAALAVGHTTDAIAVLFELSDVAELRLGDAELGERYSKQAADLAAQLPPGQVATLGPYAYAFALVSRGSCREAIELCDREISRAAAAGADEAAALLAGQRGRARCALGDLEGADECEAAAQLLLGRRHPRAASAALSAATQLCTAGRIDAGRGMLADALAWARVNAVGSNDLLFLLGLAAYEAAVFDADGRVAVDALWSEMSVLLDAATAVDHATEWMVEGARRWQRELAGEPPLPASTLTDAGVDGSAVPTYARLTVVAAAAIIAARHADAAADALADEYLHTWMDPAWDHATDYTQAQIAVVLAGCGRRADIARMVDLVAIDGPWRHLLVALAHGLDAEAVERAARMHCHGLARMAGELLHAQVV